MLKEAIKRWVRKNPSDARSIQAVAARLREKGIFVTRQELRNARPEDLLIFLLDRLNDELEKEEEAARRKAGHDRFERLSPEQRARLERCPMWVYDSWMRGTALVPGVDHPLSEK